MKEWGKFEVAAFEFLKKSIQDKEIDLELKGSKSSRDADISISYKGSELFAVEAKYLPAQCGQFVVKEKEGKYVYSERNHFEEDEESKKIVDHINREAERFSSPGSAGVDLGMDKRVYEGWVINHYRKKGTEFFVVSTDPEKFFRLIPIESVGECLTIAGTLRRKKSGSARMPKKDSEKVRKLLERKIKVPFSLSEGGILEISGQIEKGYINDKYYISKEDGFLRVKKLSETNNPNVIFSVKYAGEEETKGAEELSARIKELKEEVDSQEDVPPNSG